MPSSTFLVKVQNASPIWPSHDDEQGNRVVLTVSCIGQGPVAGTWLGRIDTVDEAAMDALKTDPAYDWVEDIEDAPAN